jgi:hypothetical protein
LHVPKGGGFVHSIDVDPSNAMNTSDGFSLRPYVVIVSSFVTGTERVTFSVFVMVTVFSVGTVLVTLTVTLMLANVTTATLFSLETSIGLVVLTATDRVSGIET